jgi:lipopolysaccharide/colanic/teichoic acid biosynthesis glycosyltransferase
MTSTLIRIILILADILLINIGFLASFLLRYGTHIPPITFPPYKSSFWFLTLIYICVLSFFGVYKTRFVSSWDLFKRIFCGLFLGTLLNVAFVYVFRTKWGAFPTTIFMISFAVNLLILFKFNQTFLKSRKRIKKKILIIGDSSKDDVIYEKAVIERIRPEEVKYWTEHTDIDEIFICGDIPGPKEMSLITYFAQRLHIDTVFSPACYVKLLEDNINNGSSHPLATFIGRKRDTEEFLIRCLDIAGSLAILLISFPLVLGSALLIKLTSEGPLLYRQQRVGKDGKAFTLYKFRTMIKDAEKQSGPVWATRNDPRVTKVGRLLRETRVDELPQLVNVITGQMSLVGPRPERPYFVKRHKILIDLRLAVKPGLTGLAQMRSVYDLHPKHKIKYDYLYIQRRSFMLNLYILAKTIPVVLMKKGQ